MIQCRGSRWSRGVRERYAALKELERRGHVTELRRFPSFTLYGWSPHGDASFPRRPIGSFTPAVAYYFEAEFVVEDAPGPLVRRSRLYRLCRAIFEANYGVQITPIGEGPGIEPPADNTGPDEAPDAFEDRREARSKA